MKRKKLLALTMAAAMIFGSSLSAVAATGTAENSTGETVTGTGDVTYVDTTVYSVTLPTSSSISLVVDPQGLAGLESGDTATSDELAVHAGTVTCASIPIVTNLSSVDMKISVALQLTGNATPVSSGDAVNTGTDTNILLYAVPSAVDTLGQASGYVGSTTGIVMTTGTAANVDFILPAATYNFTKTVSGSDVSGNNLYAVNFELAAGETGHGTGLKFEGLVNKNADWSAYANGGQSIGMTAVFTFTNNLNGAEADSTEGAPFGMVAYTGDKVTVEAEDAEPTLGGFKAEDDGTITYTLGSGALVIPYTLGAGESAKGAVTDVAVIIDGYIYSKNGTWSSDTSEAAAFTIGPNSVSINSETMDTFEPGDTEFAIVFDDDEEDYIQITLRIAE